MKISIKREQSQAGLSFAEREKFRPQVKRKRLLLLLALLMTAATGAWAQEPVTYTATMKDGTQDAKSWTITSGQKSATGDAGLTGLNEGDDVTLTYGGRLKVKGVTATYTPTVVVNKLSEITDAIAALNMQPGGEYTLNIAFDPAKIETNPTGNDNKLYMSIPDDATLNLVFNNVLPDGTHLTIGDAAFAGMSEPEVEAYFTGKDEPESKNHLNLDFAGGTGSEDVDGSGLYMELITPYSTVATGSSTGNVWFEEIIIYTGGESFFSKLGSCVKKAVVKVGKTVASVATTVGKTVAKAAMTVVKKVVNLVVTKIIKPAVEQLVEKIKQNFVKEPLIPTVITATPSNLTIFVGQSQKFDVKVVLGNDGFPGGDIWFRSSAPGIAEVDYHTGVVYGVEGSRPGQEPYSCTITAYIGDENGKYVTRECKVYVEHELRPSSVSFGGDAAEVPLGRAIIMEPNIVIGNDAISDGAKSYRLTYGSSNPAVASINEFGYVTTHSRGEATITAYYGPMTATCKVTVTESVDGMTHVLDDVIAGFRAENGDILTGYLMDNYKIEIADGATITLDNASISFYSHGGEVYQNNSPYTWAGLTCLGDATIILKDDTYNSVEPFAKNYPAIFVPEGKTLTIQGESKGSGRLALETVGESASIGGILNDDEEPIQTPGGNLVVKSGIIEAHGVIGGVANANFGDITIEGGEINLLHLGYSSDYFNAGLGAGPWATCGNITITGGKIISSEKGLGSSMNGLADDYHDAYKCGNILITGGTIAVPYLGAGDEGVCSDITITTGVTEINLVRLGPGAPYSETVKSICGTITLGCTLDASGKPQGGTVIWKDANYQNGSELYLGDEDHRGIGRDGGNNFKIFYKPVGDKSVTVGDYTIHYFCPDEDDVDRGESYASAIINHPTQNAGLKIDGQTIKNDKGQTLYLDFGDSQYAVDPTEQIFSGYFEYLTWK